MPLRDEPLYELIKRSLVDGELPGSFSLPHDGGEGRITFADGAQDGIAAYHMAGAAVTEESMKLLAELMCDVSNGDFCAGREKLMKFAADNTALNAIDDFQQYIIEHAGELDEDRLYVFAMDCLKSPLTDLVKYGMEILEVFTQPGEEQKEIIRTLGLCDEFTLFAIFHMLSWENANDEIFALAQKVHGWGRIHAVEKLQPASGEIREWLLMEGIHNRIVPDYSALAVYEKAEVKKLLSGELTGEALDAIANIIQALLSEAPVVGIHAVEDADRMLLEFVKQAECHHAAPTLAVCGAVYDLAKAKRTPELTAVAQEFLRCREVGDAVRKWILEGKGIRLAKFVGIDYSEPLLRCMEMDFDHHYYQCGELMGDESYRREVLALFRRKLPMGRMPSEPEDNLGLGEKYADYSKLGCLVQNLVDYPMCGEDFIVLALHSPVVSNRNAALRALNAWCKEKGCSLDCLSAELAQEVRVLKGRECSESVLNNMVKYGF